MELNAEIGWNRIAEGRVGGVGTRYENVNDAPAREWLFMPNLSGLVINKQDPTAKLYVEWTISWNFMSCYPWLVPIMAVNDYTNCMHDNVDSRGYDNAGAKHSGIDVVYRANHFNKVIGVMNADQGGNPGQINVVPSGTLNLASLVPAVGQNAPFLNCYSRAVDNTKITMLGLMRNVLLHDLDNMRVKESFDFKYVLFFKDILITNGYIPRANTEFSTPANTTHYGDNIQPIPSPIGAHLWMWDTVSGSAGQLLQRDYGFTTANNTRDRSLCHIIVLYCLAAYTLINNCDPKIGRTLTPHELLQYTGMMYFLILLVKSSWIFILLKNPTISDEEYNKYIGINKLLEAVGGGTNNHGINALDKKQAPHWITILIIHLHTFLLEWKILINEVDEKDYETNIKNALNANILNDYERNKHNMPFIHKKELCELIDKIEDNFKENGICLYDYKYESK